MLKVKLIISISIFSILLGITSVIKTKTRIIEKNIYKIDRKIAAIEKDLYESQLDYFYLSSPSNLSKRIKELDFIEYLYTFSHISNTSSYCLRFYIILDVLVCFLYCLISG